MKIYFIFISCLGFCFLAHAGRPQTTGVSEKRQVHNAAVAAAHEEYHQAHAAAAALPAGQERQIAAAPPVHHHAVARHHAAPVHHHAASAHHPEEAGAPPPPRLSAPREAAVVAAQRPAAAVVEQEAAVVEAQHHIPDVNPPLATGTSPVDVQKFHDFLIEHKTPLAAAYTHLYKEVTRGEYRFVRTLMDLYSAGATNDNFDYRSFAQYYGQKTHDSHGTNPPNLGIRKGLDTPTFLQLQRTSGNIQKPEIERISLTDENGVPVLSRRGVPIQQSTTKWVNISVEQCIEIINS